MKQIISACCRRMLMPKFFPPLFLFLICFTANYLSNAQTIRWINAGAATDWYTAANWTPSTTAAAWLPTNIAQFNNAGTATTAGININTSSLSIGAISVPSTRTRSLTIGNSGSVNGALQLNGASVAGFNNVILFVEKGFVPAYTITIQNTLVGATGLMDIVLGNPVDNVIVPSGESSSISINSVITGAGKNLSVRGNGSTGGIVTLNAANTYTGVTTLAARTRQLVLNHPGGGTLPSGNDVDVYDGNLVVNTNQTLHNLRILGFGAHVTVANGATLTITGTVTKTSPDASTVSTIGTGKLVYTSGASLVFGFSTSIGTEFPALYGPTNVTFTSPINMPFSRSIAGTLTVNGSVVLGANDFTAGAVTGPGRVVTDGSGKLNITNVGAAPVVFPVAASIGGAYNPVTISNGQGLTYGVRVAAGINPAGIIDPNKAVNRTWNITPVGPLSASSVNISFYYSFGDGNPGFNYLAPVDLGLYGTSWNVVQSNIPQVIPLPASVAFMVPGVSNAFVIGNVGAVH